jgi:PhnB protein
MARVSTYLNFPRTTEEAFTFYKSVFKTEFLGQVYRYKDLPPQPDQPPVPESDQNLIMHIELPILAGHVLMGGDAPDSMSFKLITGNSSYVMLEPDTRTETDRIFQALSEGAKIEMPLQVMFWGDYYGSLVDRFGTCWMFNCASQT